jgi:glycosyltransferase involved in cell wall biosynthesis
MARVQAVQEASEVERRNRLRETCSNLRVLSTVPATKSEFWCNSVETVFAERHPLSDLTNRIGIPDLAVILKLLAKANEYDLVLLTGGERADILYLALAGLLPWIRTPHVITDAHWQKSDGIAYLLQKLLLRLGRRLTVQVQPHSREEIPLYHDLFGVPIEALRAVPWSTTLTGHDVSDARPEERGDVLTGGLSFRDYETLFAGLRGLDLRLDVGLPNDPPAETVKRLADGLSNVVFHTDWSNEQFIRKMAGCRVFALPIVPGLTRCTADQSILNAMYFGRIVVATDSIGSRAYIQDGVNGFLVPERSPAAWAETLQMVRGLDEAGYRAIGTRAAHDARGRFSESLRLIRTLESALAALPETPGHL